MDSISMSFATDLTSDKTDLIRAAEAMIQCIRSFPDDVLQGLDRTPNDPPISLAIIGGTACVLHGSDRSTRDVDFVCRLPWNKILPLKKAVAACDPCSFEARGQSLYFYPAELAAGLGAVVIEIIPADSFIWPTDLDAASTFIRSPLGETLLPVLKPPALFFSKIVRLFAVIDSDRPRTLEVRAATIHDLLFLARVLDTGDLARAFKLYLPAHRSTLRRHLTWASSVGQLAAAGLSSLLRALPPPEPDEDEHTAGRRGFSVASG